MSVRLRPAAPGDEPATPADGTRAVGADRARPNSAARRPGRWGRVGVLLVLVAVLVGTGSPDGDERTLANGASGGQLLELTHRDAGPVLTGSAPVVTAVGSVTAAAPTVSPAQLSESTVLRLPGPVPERGRGTFSYDTGQSPVLGRAGTLRRYRVAVEVGAGEDVAAFGTAVDRALADPSSWIGSGRLRLQRVPAGAAYDFTVYLVTPQTARRMCAEGGVDIRVGGRPYTSCRAVGKVIINLERWRRSVEHFVAARVPLSVYRTYVVNHEVGHELGHRHERCPGRGRPAPVMMQQTLFLSGCVANPWPYVDGRRYTGPLL